MSAFLTASAMGSVPVMSVSYNKAKEQMNLTCHSCGWSPEPTAIWAAEEGNVIQRNGNNIFTKGMYIRG